MCSVIKLFKVFIMPINVNVALSDKTYEILQRVKLRGHFRTNADAVTFALIVAAESKQLQQLEGGRLTEGIPVAPDRFPSGEDAQRTIMELIRDLQKRVESLEKLGVKVTFLPEEKEAT